MPEVQVVGGPLVAAPFFHHAAFGPGAKAVEKKVLDRFPWVDLVAHGEAERAVVPLVKALQNGHDLSQVPGVFYRTKSGGIARNPPPERIQKLDTIGRPAYGKVDLKAYDAYGMISSRGCPYKCSFCSVAPVWNHRCFFRSPGDVVAEMQELHERAGVELFLFQDEFFVSAKSAVMKFCELLARSGLKVYWKAFARVDLAGQEMMETMARTGCVEIRFGIESGSDEILRRTQKGFTSEMAVDVVSRATQLFPRVDTFFIWGFPDETMEDFYQSLFQMVSFRLMGARILPSLLCLLPQTELYASLGEDRLSKLEFCEQLLPEYVITGHEICGVGTVSIADRQEAAHARSRSLRAYAAGVRPVQGLKALCRFCVLEKPRRLQNGNRLANWALFFGLARWTMARGVAS